MSQPLLNRIPHWLPLLLAPGLGFALSLKNAVGCPSLAAGATLIGTCTLCGALWGVCLSWAISKSVSQVPHKST